MDAGGFAGLTELLGASERILCGRGLLLAVKDGCGLARRAEERGQGGEGRGPGC